MYHDIPVSSSSSKGKTNCSYAQITMQSPPEEKKEIEKIENIDDYWPVLNKMERCRYCDISIKSNLMTIHIEEIHSCPICNKAFGPKFIEEHINKCIEASYKNKPSASSNYSNQDIICPLCQKRFPPSFVEQHAADCMGGG